MAEHPVTRADGDAPDHEPIPPATEQVHLPGPSYEPVVVAFGVTLALVGVVISVALVVVGILIVVVATVRWIRETREDISELPLEH